MGYLAVFAGGKFSYITTYERSKQFHVLSPTPPALWKKGWDHEVRKHVLQKKPKNLLQRIEAIKCHMLYCFIVIYRCHS